MGLKGNIALIGIGLLAIVALAKPIGGLFGQVGTTVGSSLQMGLQNFVSALSGGVIPSVTMQSGQMMGSMTPTQMMTMLTMNPMTKPILIGNVDTTGNAGGLFPGGKVITDANGNPIDLLGNNTSPSIGAVDITPNNINSLIDMLTGQIRSSSSDVTLTSSSISDIFKQATDFFLKGGQDVGSFLKTYKFPSGESLGDVLGGIGKGGLTPDAFGQLQTISQIMGTSPNGLVDINTSSPVETVRQGRLSTIGNSSDMLQMMNLNMDKKIDTPYGVIETGGNPNSIGLGKGTILPAQNLTQVLQNNPGLTASQAADLLYRMMNPSSSFNFGTNNGGGYTGFEVLNPNPTLLEKTMGIMPMVIGLEYNPVLLAYQNYKAMYGIS